MKKNKEDLRIITNRILMKFSRNISIFLFSMFMIQVSCKNNTHGSGEDSDGPSDISSSIRIPVDENSALDTTDVAKITFDAIDLSFDTIAEGTTVSRVFQFENTGSRPLLLYDVRTSCGCTAADFPKEFIHPGQSGKITVQFDSNGRTGYQNKSINVIGNTFPTRTLLSLQGFVKK